MTARVAARVDGVVQGVGFRPFAFRLAEELGLSGFVGNDARGVLLEVEGERTAVDAFLRALRERPPPLARVASVSARDVALRGDGGFAIVPSGGGGPDALVAPDAGPCDACLRELADPADRRYRYPFLNCTDCGPRFTIVRDVPYDRARTTMAGFAMCADCRREYDDPRDRRFHAQPVACPACGPRLRLTGGEGAHGMPALAGAARLLREGAVIAIKGVGGFHLACRAGDEAAVSRLRARKHREDKPFALLAADLDAAGRLVVLGEPAARLMASPARPIVLAPRRPGAAVAASVAPGLAELGVLLPPSPLHHLIAGDAGEPLVLTSGNRSDEPIAYEDDDALERLGGIADAFLLHDRPIRTRTDDSVARVTGGRPQLLRRARGHVPEALVLPVPAARHVLACGAEQKVTACVARGARAWVGPHVGDLRDLGTLASYEDGIGHLERLFAVRPEVVAHDLHPDMLSTAYAAARPGVRLVGVQHHHAHLAAALAEHGETGPAVGAIFDGAGLGTDGTVWGGELLVGDLRGFRRVGHLRPVALPGGDRAAREPWRMACAWLVAAGDPEPAVPDVLRDAVDPRAWRAVARMARTGVQAPGTTSAGRLFDALAALTGLHPRTTFEGQAAMAFEAEAAASGDRGAYDLPAGPDLVLDPGPLVRAVVADVRAGAGRPAIAARAHRALARATAGACGAAASREGLDLVVLAGGVWANRVLLEATTGLLRRQGLRVLVPRRLPPGDGGISFGQAAVAAATEG